MALVLNLHKSNHLHVKLQGTAAKTGTACLHPSSAITSASTLLKALSHCNLLCYVPMKAPPHGLTLACTLLWHNEEVAVSVAEAGVGHGGAGRVHVDGIPVLACRAAQT